MDRLLYIYDKYKKAINLFLIIVVISLIVGIVCLKLNYNNPSNNETSNEIFIEKIVLFGNNIIEINKGDKYVEPGYYAITNTGEIKRDDILVNSNLNTSKAGTYIIKYILGNKTITRTIKVLETEDASSDITFKLQGDSMIILEQGMEYKEPGFLAYDDTGNDYSNQVIVNGNVDNNKPGTYELTYTLTIDGKIYELTRQIIVNNSIIDATITLDNSNYTNNDVSITINATGNNFSYVRLPDNTYSENLITNYDISSNGTYTFYIYDKNSNYIVREITINNIDKDIPSGTCKAIYQKGQTNISVTANDNTSGIKNYYFYGDNRLLLQSSKKNYSTSSKLASAYVLIYDNAGNYRQVNCEIEIPYNLEVHFINVGREDAIVIRDSSKTIFIDGGTYNKGTKITNYLKDLGVTHIDAIIGSHLHYNHIQAQAALLNNFTVYKIYYPQDLNTCYSKYCDKNDQKYILDAIKKYKKNITIMKVGDSINIGDMNIYCIGPISFQTKSQNKYRQNYNSLNFILTYGNNKFLFTGDYVQYSNILKKFDKSLLDVDVLKYPHHGNASLSKSFVNAISPKYVILTNSRDELSSRSEKSYLANVGASFYYSYKHGNILITSDGSNLAIKTNVKASDYKR